MLLYDSQVSGNCWKVRQLFAHLGVEYERRELSVIDRSDRKEVLGAWNPGLRVPTLVLDDGRSLAESNAITFYAYSQVAPEGGFELEPYPAIQAWLERVAAQPGHIAITQ